MSVRCRCSAPVNDGHARIVGKVVGLVACVVYSYLSARHLERAWSSGDRAGMAVWCLGIATMIAYGLVLVRRLVRLLGGSGDADYAVGAIDRGRKNPKALV
jgi:hypothetical protein